MIFVKESWKDLKSGVHAVTSFIHKQLFDRETRKKSFKKLAEMSITKRIQDFRVIFLVTFDRLDRKTAESKEFQDDLATQVSQAAGYNVPLDFLDKEGRPIVLRRDAVHLEVEKEGHGMEILNPNKHVQAFKQRKLKIRRQTASSVLSMLGGGGGGLNRVRTFDDDGNPVQMKPKRGFGLRAASMGMRFFTGRGLRETAGAIQDDAAADAEVAAKNNGPREGETREQEEEKVVADSSGVTDIEALAPEGKGGTAAGKSDDNTPGPVTESIDVSGAVCEAADEDEPPDKPDKRRMRQVSMGLRMFTGRGSSRRLSSRKSLRRKKESSRRRRKRRR